MSPPDPTDPTCALPSSVAAAVSTRLPTNAGSFQMSLHPGADGREHVALYVGELDSGAPVLARIHSECFTGDVMGSRRCDCGPQLDEALRRIAAEGRGVLLYMRQEGRGIGLLEKLKAYNLQDQGYDTLDANVALGHPPDARDYTVAGGILRALGVRAVHLMTNNPAKISGLEAAGVPVASRVALQLPANADNYGYLRTKAERMGHTLDLERPHLETHHADQTDALFAQLAGAEPPPDRPFVTLSYAQSLDGCSAAVSDRPLALSGGRALQVTHRLRAAHDAILVGIGTVLSDDPRLNVRLVEGSDPQPVVMDSRLRFPLDARLLRDEQRRPWIATTEAASPDRARRLEERGATLIRLPANRGRRVSLRVMLSALRARGIRSIMVEGGGRIITEFLRERCVDMLALTIAPRIVGGVRAVHGLQQDDALSHPRLTAPRYAPMGRDMLVWGAPIWGDVEPPALQVASRKRARGSG